MNRTAAVPVPAVRPRRRSPARIGGMTLIELMVTLAVAALVVTLGAPTMLRLLARHAIAAQAEELQDAVRIGRNEAMKRGGPVVLCRTDASNTSHCAGNAGDWQTWLLFADVARTGTFAGGDPILRQHLDVSSRMTVVGNAAGVRFESTGIAHSDAGSAVFVLSPAGASAGSAASDRGTQRQVCVNPRAEVVVVSGNETCP
jgi:type IV fimbrial biogenesis protein FimT